MYDISSKQNNIDTSPIEEEAEVYNGIPIVQYLADRALHINKFLLAEQPVKSIY